MKRYYHEFESEIEVTDSPDSCFSDGSDTKTINFGAPDGLLNNSACLNPLPTCCLWCWKWIRYRIFPEKKKNTVTSHIVHLYYKYGIHFKKLKPFSFRFCPTISKKPGEHILTLGTVIDCFFELCLMPKFKMT